MSILDDLDELARDNGWHLDEVLADHPFLANKQRVWRRGDEMLTVVACCRHACKIEAALFGTETRGVLDDTSTNPLDSTDRDQVVRTWLTAPSDDPTGAACVAD